MSPIDTHSDNNPPPPPAHRQPVSPQHYQHPNDYSDYSTPGMSPGYNSTAGPYGQPMGVPEHGSTPFSDHNAYDSQPMPPRPMYSQQSYGSSAPLAPGSAGLYSSNSSMHSITSPPQGVPYSDSPYNRYSSTNLNLATNMGHINPNEVADDDDWGMGPDTPQAKRRSFLPIGASRDGSRNGSPGSSINNGAAGVGAAAIGAAAGGSAYAATRDGNKYNAVPTIAGSNGSNPELLQEKENWKKADLRKRKKRMWIAIAIIAVILLAAILGGVLGALLGTF